MYTQVLTNEAGERGQASVAKARTVLKLMQEAGVKADLRIYRGMLGVFVEAVGAKGGEGMMVETFRLLDRMRAAGLQPDRSCYHLVLRGYMLSVSRGGPVVSHFERSCQIVLRMAREVCVRVCVSVCMRVCTCIYSRR
jgi:hypothetical protein